MPSSVAGNDLQPPAVDPDAGREARVRLGTFDREPAREFFLNPDNPSIIIGRSSQRTHSGAHARTNNAYFDTPTMSRDHAELRIDSDGQETVCASPFGQKPEADAIPPQVLQIRDIKSTHGTFLNGEKLVPYKPYPVKNEDFITFATAVTCKNSECMLPDQCSVPISRW
jgi:pSer/pThr/pTyr-binding forkhead associated (FHA) protein